MPEWLTKHGIEPGGFQFVTKAQLRSQMRPDRPLKVQVWACGMLHTVAYQGEVAYTKFRDKRVLMQPAHIIKELHHEAIKYFKELGGVDIGEFHKLKESKESLRRALDELEEDGLCDRKAGEVSLKDMSVAEAQHLPSGRIEYHFYLNPRSANPGKVLLDWEKFKRAWRKDLDNIEVVKNRTHADSISLVLKAFSFGKVAKSVICDPAFQQAFSKGYEAARKVLEEVVTEWLPKEVVTDCPPVTDQEVVTPCLDFAPEVGTPGGAFVRKVERRENALSSSVVGLPGFIKEESSNGRAGGNVQEAPPARPEEGNLHQELRAFLLKQPVKTPLDEPMFHRIAVHIQDSEALARFQAVAEHVKNPRKWAVYEILARQVKERGPTPEAKAAGSELSATMQARLRMAH